MLNATHFKTTAGYVIDVLDITHVSLDYIDGEDAVAMKLEGYTKPQVNHIFVKVKPKDVYVVDIEDSYNKIRLVPGNEYASTEFYRQLFVENWIAAKRGSKK